MLSVALFAIAFLCPLIGVAIGMAVRGRVPAHHLNHDAVEVIKLAMGLMVALVALTLGLLISSANNYHTMIETEYKETLAGIVHLDEYLGAYGPEAAPIRRLVSSTAARSFEERWPTDSGQPGPEPNVGKSRFVDVQRKILELQPADATQKWFQGQALQVTNELSKLRWLVANQQTATAPLMPVFVLIFLSSIAIFAGFSLYAPPNPTILGVFLLTALAIGGATFLIVELSSPFHGMLEVSSHGAHTVMQMLGQPS